MDYQKEKYNKQDVDNLSTVNQEFEEKEGVGNKSKILIVIEVILLILVIFLAVIFFTNRRGGAINFFSGSENNEQPAVRQNSSDNVQINENISAEDDNINPIQQTQIPANSRPIAGNSQTVESYRLTAPVPDQSFVSSESDIPEEAIKLSGEENGFYPNEFRVKVGEEVTLALTSRIKYPVILTFYEESMPAISIGCGPYETRWITFTAPTQPGEYEFRNDVFGKTDQVGKMIVE